MKLTEYAMKFKTTIYVLIALIVLVGGTAYNRLPLEDNPEVQIPILLVNTIYPGVAPADMEKLVTNIVERELKDLKDVKEMSSSSAESVSLVKIEFESGVDMDEAYQKVRDKVDKAKPDLPVDAEDPVLIEINVSEFPMMLINVSGDYELDRLKKIAEDLEEKIERIPGILGVDLTGGLEREIQIFLDPDKLSHFKIGVGQVIMRIQQEHLTTPAGNLQLGKSKYSVRIPGEYKNVSLMEQMVIKAPGGNPVKLKDIGHVVDGIKERETISRANGKECITLRVKKRSGENIVSIADDIRALLDGEKSALPEGTELMIRQDSSEMIRDTVKDLENSIISGLLLVLLVLFFAMGLRNASFVALAIPLSMLITFGALRMMGVTLNMVVLFSLILALGMLVDNSIVVVENIFRHASDGKSRTTAALLATREVAWPIIASTATTVLVFAPILFWPGLMGEWMKFLPQTVITALIASLFVALVINPVIASDFLKTGGKKLFDDSGSVKGPVMTRYKKLLGFSLDHPLLLAAIGLGLLVSSFAAYGTFGAGVEFFPNSDPERVQATIQAPQGIAIETTDEYSRLVEKIAGGEENVEDVIANVGMSSNPYAASGSSNQAVLDIEFKDRHQRSRSTWESVEELRKMVAGLAGAEFRVNVPKDGPPTGAPVSVEISGPDFRVLQRKAREIKEIIASVPGVVDLKDDFEGGKPEIRIDVDREQAMLRKVNTAAISQAVRTAINGTKASVLREGDEEYDIVVRYDMKHRQSFEDLLNIKVLGKDDVQVPLRDVASVQTTGGLGSINHIDQMRTILVSGDVQGERSSSEVMMEVQMLLNERMEIPDGYFLSYSGESEEQDKATAFLSEAFLIGILLMAMVLITQFNSVIRPLIILASVVMSLVGVLLGLMLTQTKFGIIMTGMGVISLAGVVVNNAIVMIDYTNQLRIKEGLSVREALEKAGVVRFRPVLLTAITTILGMTPMALGVAIDFTSFTIDTGAVTTQMWQPMAKAVIFGLSFATLLTLVAVPVMYLLQENSTAWLSDKLNRLRGKNAAVESPSAENV